MATTNESQKRWYNDRELFLHGFVRSNYVTAFTDWFMGLAGKATELVLYATVLYSCAQLYPGVQLPTGLSLAVFLIQMGALDIGGLSLGKLAKQARVDGNTAGANGAERLSKWLIGIMLVGVVTVGLEHALPVALPSWVIVSIDVVLVVARSICAVLYGRVVHDLKHETTTHRVSESLSLVELLTTHIEQTLTKHLEASGITATLEAHEQSITTLNALPASIDKTLACVKAELVETLQDLFVNIPGSATRPKLSIVGNGVSDEVNVSGKKDFVYSMLTKHPEIRNTEIIQEASKQGITITSGYVSQIRKVFTEEQSA